MKLSNTPPPDVTAVQITDERLTFGLEDGRTVSVPLLFYPTLQLATRRERADFEISHTSFYWPKLDCDISSGCLRVFAPVRLKIKSDSSMSVVPITAFRISVKISARSFGWNPSETRNSALA